MDYKGRLRWLVAYHVREMRRLTIECHIRDILLRRLGVSATDAEVQQARAYAETEFEMTKELDPGLQELDAAGVAMEQAAERVDRAPEDPNVRTDLERAILRFDEIKLRLSSRRRPGAET